MSNIVKSKFVRLLRGLLRRFDDGPATTVAPSRPMATTALLRTTHPRTSSPAAALQSKPQNVLAPPPAAPSASLNGLQLPLPSIIALLPMDLRAKLMQTPPASAFVSIPVEKILSQLANGSVKITFGELRTALPGLFVSSGTENDVRQIALPLKEIISRINPTLLSRRAMKKVGVADDITGPFVTQAQGISFTSSQVPTKTGPVPPAKTPEPVSAQVAQQSIAPPPAFVPKVKVTAPRSTPVAPDHIAPAAGDFNSAPQIPVENSILVPLAALADGWPDAIKMELVQTGLMSAQAGLPAALIESGLKGGRVTITWKNLRLMIRPKPAPVSVHDGVKIELPLKILAPLYFSSQKAAGQLRQKVSVSAEIPDLFYGSKQAEATISPIPAPASAPAPATAAKPWSDLFIAPSSPKIETTATIAPALIPAPALASAAPVVPVPSTLVKPVFSAPPAAPVAPAASEQKIISAPLAALSEKWPDALRLEIQQWNLADAQVALPLDAVAPAMKRGRVTFAWRDLRSWIRPTPPATESVHDNAELELPLKVIAPLFLERQTSPARPQSRLTLDKSIPNSFFGFPSAEMEAPVTAPAAEPVPEPARPALKPVDARLSETNYYVWGDDSDTPRIDASEYKRPQTPATDFTSRHANPKEIVARTIVLPGVAGVVVALYDGLMIAGQVPPDLNADTVAAFLPQIFDRVAQCTRELRMGALNNLKFTVGNVPWHIFRVNAVYFAAFGQAGGSLPTAQLTSLAGELDRKKQ
jgi:predicted regulator of Ras-like GTPase activity (Roadblock/LC7/MglB family)